MAKLKVRKGVFETNSSSVHTLVLNGGSLPKLSSDLDFNNGVLTIKCGDFKSINYVTGQKKKLEYLATIIYLYHRWDLEGKRQIKTGEPDTPWLLNDLFYALNKNFPEIQKIVIKNLKGAIMDQLYVEYDGNIVNITDESNVIMFVFNDSLSVKIWND